MSLTLGFRFLRHRLGGVIITAKTCVLTFFVEHGERERERERERGWGGEREREREKGGRMGRGQRGEE